MMKSLSALMVLTASTLTAQSLPEWQTVEHFRDGQIDSHALVVPYKANDVKAVSEMGYENSPYYLNLNGKWKFNWVEGVDNRPVGFQYPAYDVSSWADINVPGNWERQGYGTTIYVNTTYEFDTDWASFKKNWPLVPTKTNEVGSYRRNFTIPADWEGRRVVLCVEGAISFYYAWVNGEYLGCNQDSKTAAEWDITDKLVKGENTVALEVYRWSAGAYYECQDFWRLSGIERDVYLYSTPQTYISDFTVRSPLDSTYTDGKLTLEVDVANLPVQQPAADKKARKSKKNLPAPAPFTVGYTLFDADGKQVSKQKHDASSRMAFDATLPAVNAWSAEHPYLYTLLVDLYDPEGKLTETVGCNVGFRTSEVKNGLFLLNGMPIKIKGANRHAHSQMGRTVPRDTALIDIEILKKNNFNAVRNCHYPQDRYWYYLCDKYGIYLVDEANCESHGYGYGDESLAKQPEWTPAVIDRNQRMYHKSKNNPSVTFYSLGNECGNGIVFEEAYKWMKQAEHNRPIQYERALNDWNSDIYAEMYGYHSGVEAYALDSTKTRPYILCEYSHAMGNSVGGLQDYWDLFEAHPKLQGGLVWDFVDQGFLATDSLGRRYWAYGGDFGPANVPSDNSFNCNGLINAARVPHPAMAEVKKVYQYIKCRLMDPGSLTIEVKNWYDFTNLDQYTLTWKVVTPDGQVLLNGTRNIACAPHKSVLVSLGTYPGTDAPEAYLDLSWTPNNDALIVKHTDEVAYDQFTLPGTAAPAEQPVASKLRKKADTFTAGTLSFTVSPATGEITSLTRGGNELIASPIALSIYRQPTENDLAWVGRNRQWVEEGLDSVYQKATSIKLKANKVNVTADIYGRNGNIIARANYAYYADATGNLAIDCDFIPDTAAIKNMPRLGLTFTMPEAQAPTVTYLGRSGETYVDRRSAGRIGTWTVKPVDDFHIYTKPSEAGNHTDVRYVRFNGTTPVTVTAPAHFQFSAYPYSDMAVRKALHTSDLTPEPIVTVHLDARQTGVGTATCGPDVLEKYFVPVEPTRFSFYISTK